MHGFDLPKAIRPLRLCNCMVCFSIPVRLTLQSVKVSPHSASGNPYHLIRALSCSLIFLSYAACKGVYNLRRSCVGLIPLITDSESLNARNNGIFFAQDHSARRLSMTNKSSRRTDLSGKSTCLSALFPFFTVFVTRTPHYSSPHLRLAFKRR